MDMNRCLVIGISGTTCSGKTTLTTHLLRNFPNALVLHQDDFFYDLDNPKLNQIRDEKLQCWNWESLEALDMVGFTEKLIGMKAFQCSHLPQSVNYKNFYEIPLIFAEGFGIYNYSPVASLIDCKFFLTLTRDQCQDRRSQRIYSPSDGPLYFDSYVWPCYLRMKEEIDTKIPDVIYIDGEQSEEDVTQQALETLRKFLNSKYGLVESNSEDVPS